MKTTLICLAIALACRVAFDLNAQTWQPAPKSYSFTSAIHGDWLTVRRFNSLNDKDQWHPSFVAVTSDYRPLVSKKDGKWVIEFTNDLTNDLP